MFYLLFAVIIHSYCCIIKNFLIQTQVRTSGNCSPIHDKLYVLKMKKHIENIITLFDSEFNH